MALKSILSVDVDDAKFKKFKEIFDKYQEQLKAMPESWKAASVEQDAMLQGFARVTAALMAHSDASAQLSHIGEKNTAETDKQAKAWQSIARASKQADGHVVSMTRSFLKWSGIAGLAGGLLSGLGFMHLVGGVATLRQNAMGLGVTPGQASAFGIDFGRFVGDPRGMLARVSEALSDPTSAGYRAIVSTLGDVRGKNAAQVSVELLRVLPRLFPGGANDPTLGAVAQARSLTALLSIEDIKRRLSAQPGEFSKQERDYISNASAFNLSSSVTRQWQDFNTQLQKADKLIETTLITGLTPLADPLTKLSQSVSNVVGSFLDAAAKRHWITGLADDLEKFGKYIGTNDFQKKVVGLVDDLERLGNAVKWLVSWLPSSATKTPSANDGIGIFSNKPLLDLGPLGTFDPKWTVGHDTFEKYKATGKALDDLLALVRQDETRGRVGMEHAVSPAGAVGLYQITPATARSYGRDPYLLQNVQYNEQTARIILANLIKRYNGNLDRVLAAYHSGPGAVDTMHLGPAGREYIEYAHKQNNFRQVQIEVKKAAGADVNVSVQQMPTWLSSGLAFSPGG